MPLCRPNQSGRLNLRAVDLFLGSSWWILGLYEPSEIERKYFYTYVLLTIFLEKGPLHFIIIPKEASSLHKYHDSKKYIRFC